jgi:uncharacterized protein YbbC (DUF1343 family)
MMTGWAEIWNQKHPEATLRPLLFVPTFHKHKNQICYGFQLHPTKKIHSLLYTLRLLQALKQNAKDMVWLSGKYEAGSDRAAIELLTGDEDLISYLNGEAEDQRIIEKMKEQEYDWIRQVKPFLLYHEPLFSIL